MVLRFLLLSLALGLISCGEPAQKACSDGEVVNTVKAGLFGRDLMAAFIAGEHLLKEKYRLSDDEIRTIYEGLKRSSSQEEAVNLIASRVGSKIELLNLLSVKEFPKGVYRCGAVFRFPNGESYRVDYEVKRGNPHRWAVKIKKLTPLGTALSQR
jgi:hypothetical protein